MLELHDVVEIQAPPERVFDWFLHLPENYRAWHPAHVCCRYLRGGALEDGSVLYAEEYLHGRLHRLRFTLTEVEPGREIRFRVLPGVRGGFRLRPTAGGTELEADLFFGTAIPVLGALVDALLRALLSKQIEAIRQHMREEDVNLRVLLAPEAV